jgi:(p)ppGpp synthase/HD superfamily hydrolase
LQRKKAGRGKRESAEITGGFLLRALDSAARAHALKQRKESKVPYLVHPARVVERLRSLGIRDERVLAAAFLHDTLEDTGLRPAQIKKKFGTQVLSLVKQLTKHGELDVKQLRTPEAILIKMMDRIDNIQDFMVTRGKVKPDYIEEAEAILARAMEFEGRSNDPVRRELRSAIAQLIAEIEKARRASP